MVTVTALVRAALGWQIKADGEGKIEQRAVTGKYLEAGFVHLFWQQTLSSRILSVCLG